MAPGLPGITAFAVPLDLNTLRLIWPTAISVAFVGLLETLLTAKLVDDLTDTRSHKGRESWALEWPTSPPASMAASADAR